MGRRKRRKKNKDQQIFDKILLCPLCKEGILYISTTIFTSKIQTIIIFDKRKPDLLPGDKKDIETIVEHILLCDKCSFNHNYDDRNKLIMDLQQIQNANGCVLDNVSKASTNRFSKWQKTPEKISWIKIRRKHDCVNT